MRTLTIAGALALCSWLATTTYAQLSKVAADKEVPQSVSTNTDPAPEVLPDAKPGAAQEATQTPTVTAKKSGDAWRYVYHNNQWWYYKPNKQWVMWNGGRWLTTAEMARPAAVDQQPHQAGFRGNDTYRMGTGFYQPQPMQDDPRLGRPIYRRFFPNMPFVPYPENPATSQPVTGAGMR